MEPTRPVPPRTIQTRTQTELEQETPRRHLRHFGYPSESKSQHETIEQPITDLQQPLVFPKLDDLEALFSDQEKCAP